MTIPAATKNAMLDGVTFTHASLHSAFPGATGTNEISGGAPAYARKVVVVNPSSGGQRALNAAVAFDVPISTVRWIGFWNSAVFVAAVPNGGAMPKNFIAVPTSDLMYSTGHAYADATPVVVYGGTPPTGLTEGTIYFVRDAAADTFKLAATAGGVAIDLTASASFGAVVCAITSDVYAAQGTHTLSTFTFAVPD